MRLHSLWAAYHRIKPTLPQLNRGGIHETRTSRCHDGEFVLVWFRRVPSQCPCFAPLRLFKRINGKGLADASGGMQKSGIAKANAKTNDQRRWPGFGERLVSSREILRVVPGRLAGSWCGGVQVFARSGKPIPLLGTAQTTGSMLSPVITGNFQGRFLGSPL